MDESGAQEPTWEARSLPKMNQRSQKAVLNLVQFLASGTQKAELSSFSIYKL